MFILRPNETMKRKKTTTNKPKYFNKQKISGTIFTWVYLYT